MGAMTGGLRALLERLLAGEAAKTAVPEAAGLVGDQLFRRVETAPTQVFQMGAAPITGDAVRNRLGVRLVQSNDGYRTWVPAESTGKDYQFADSWRGPIARIPSDYGDLLPRDSLGDLYNTVGLQGNGAGTRVYRAMMDDSLVSGVPTVADAALSPINRTRRSLHDASLMMRAGREAPLATYPAQSQLNLGPRLGELSQSDFLALPREGQLGALRLYSMLKTLKNLDVNGPRALATAKASSADSWQRFNGDMLARSGLFPAETRALIPPTDLSSSDYARMAADLRDGGLGGLGIGPTTLRKLADTDALLRGATPAPQSWAGAEYRQGGLVQIQRQAARSCCGAG